MAPAFGLGFGPGFPPHPVFPRPRGRRGHKAARGDVRSVVLALLAEQPMHGYQIIQEITRRSAGAWRPSPGSVYPTLAQLEDEGLVRTERSDGRRVVHLTADGTRWVDERRTELDRVWEAVGDGVDEAVIETRDELARLGAAVLQVMEAGTDAQLTTARDLLAETRKAVYRLLAE